jgi:hypothetical protein
MKKLFLLGIVLVLALTACGSKEEAPAYSSEYEQACFDIGGLMGPNGCVLQVADAPAPTEDSPEVENPVSAPASDCVKQAEEIGVPEDVIPAICEATPSGTGVSMRLPAGTKVEIGTITFDAENRVWFLQDFVVPSMASYAFEYAGSERAIFDAPFVTGSELGWAKDGTRVPFTICWDVTSEGCIPPTELFPTN